MAELGNDPRHRILHRVIDAAMPLHPALIIVVSENGSVLSNVGFATRDEACELLEAVLQSWRHDATWL